MKPPEERSIITTPIHMVKDVVKGGAEIVSRRAHEVSGDIGGVIRGTVNTIVQPFISPIETITNPGKYLAQPLSAVTSGASGAKNFALGLGPRNMDEGGNTIGKTMQRMGNKIPFIGKWIISKPAEYMGKLMHKGRKAIDWAGSLIKKTLTLR